MPYPELSTSIGRPSQGSVRTLQWCPVFRVAALLLAQSLAGTRVLRGRFVCLVAGLRCVLTRKTRAQTLTVSNRTLAAVNKILLPSQEKKVQQHLNLEKLNRDADCLHSTSEASGQVKGQPDQGARRNSSASSSAVPQSESLCENCWSIASP